jgi:hypothetical protein
MGEVTPDEARLLVDRELVEEERAETGERSEAGAGGRGREDDRHEEALPDAEPGTAVLDQQREDAAVDDCRTDQQALRDRDPGKGFAGRRHPGI